MLYAVDDNVLQSDLWGKDSGARPLPFESELSHLPAIWTMPVTLLCNLISSGKLGRDRGEGLLWWLSELIQIINSVPYLVKNKKINLYTP